MVAGQGHCGRKRVIPLKKGNNKGNNRSLLMITMYENLQHHLSERKKLLEGKWILNNSGYEDDICHILEMKHEESRYYDASWESYFIEFKKGKSIWLDLVRYSEMVLKTTAESAKETITLFFPHNANWTRIEQIIGVPTSKIIEKMNLNAEIAKTIFELKERVPRSLNAQASLTLNDVKKMAEFIV